MPETGRSLRISLSAAQSLRPSILPNLPEPLRQNKTVGLVTWERSVADGN
jgi:hypothetical protein